MSSTYEVLLRGDKPLTIGMVYRTITVDALCASIATHEALEQARREGIRHIDILTIRRKSVEELSYGRP